MGTPRGPPVVVPLGSDGHLSQAVLIHLAARLGSIERLPGVPERGEAGESLDAVFADTGFAALDDDKVLEQLGRIAVLVLPEAKLVVFRCLVHGGVGKPVPHPLLHEGDGPRSGAEGGRRGGLFVLDKVRYPLLHFQRKLAASRVETLLVAFPLPAKDARCPVATAFLGLELRQRTLVHRHQLGLRCLLGDCLDLEEVVFGADFDAEDPACLSVPQGVERHADGPCFIRWLLSIGSGKTKYRSRSELAQGLKVIRSTGVAAVDAVGVIVQGAIVINRNMVHDADSVRYRLFHVLDDGHCGWRTQTLGPRVADTKRGFSRSRP